MEVMMLEGVDAWTPLSIITPGKVAARVQVLDGVWKPLANSKVQYVKNEYAAWRAYADDLLSSYWNRVFGATETLSELDAWSARYKEAWIRAEQEVKSAAVVPDATVVKDNTSLFPEIPKIPTSVWLVGGAILAYLVWSKLGYPQPWKKSRLGTPPRMFPKVEKTEGGFIIDGKFYPSAKRTKTEEMRQARKHWNRMFPNTKMQYDPFTGERL